MKRFRTRLWYAWYRLAGRRIRRLLLHLEMWSVRESDLRAPAVREGIDVVAVENDLYGLKERVSFERLDELPMWNVVIEHWPADRYAAVGVASRYRRPTSDSALLLDDDMRGLALAALEELLRAYGKPPPQREGELMDLIRDVDDLLVRYRPGVGVA